MHTRRPLTDFMPRPDFQWPPQEEQGRLEGLESWARPLSGVRIDGDYLSFEYRKPYVEGRGPVELATADLKMLADFTNLAEGDPAVDGRLLRFASHYGTLGLCKVHGWPIVHFRPHCPAYGELTDNGYWCRERIADWLEFSCLARAVVVALTARVKNEREGALARLQAFLTAVPSDEPQGIETAWEPYRVVLRWIDSGELKLWFFNRPPRLTLYGIPPLWNALGMEMAMLAVGAKGLVLCSACGRLDTVKKPGRPGNRTYCRKCRQRARVRDSTRDLRSRERETRDLRSQGMNITEIAAKLGISRDRVKRYLSKEQ
jgi:hypothetical protein